nr:alginate export family protein [uncultured Capnocytophaga sp.]
MKEKFFKLGALLALTAIAPCSLQAQEEGNNTFDLSAQIRPRFEYRNGAYTPQLVGDSPAILVNNRTRLNFEYKNSDMLKVYLSVQNVNVWGQAKQIQAIDPTGGMSVFEAYASFPLSSEFTAKIGRQVISLDDERIFGALDWHPAGRAHDAVNIDWKPSDEWTIRSFFAYNQANASGNLNVNVPKGQNFTSAGGQDYQHLEAFHAHYDINADHGLSFLFANLGFKENSAKANNMQTFGAHYAGKAEDLSFGGTAYLQTGKNAAGVSKSAFMLAANVGYKFSPSFSLKGGIDYLSGKGSNDTSASDKVFNPFSGTNHKFYGFMDYYYVGAPGSNAVPTAGLFNPYINATVRTGEKSNLGATLHYFAPAAKFQNYSSFGGELDLVYSLNVQKFVGLQVGYSTYFLSDGIKAVKGVSPANPARGYQDWLWCSLNINPRIFSAIF